MGFQKGDEVRVTRAEAVMAGQIGIVESVTLKVRFDDGGFGEYGTESVERLKR